MSASGISLLLDNETHFASRDLRKFILAGFRAFGVSPGRKRVIVLYTRRKRMPLNIGGRAIIGRSRLVQASKMWLTLPRDAAELTPAHLEQFARVIEHEALHWFGVRHRDMTRPQLYSSGPAPAWCAGLTIGIKAAPKKRTLAEVVEKRAAHARAMLAKHEARLKRQQALVAKWSRKVRYYDEREEQRIAASRAAAPAGT